MRISKEYYKRKTVKTFLSNYITLYNSEGIIEIIISNIKKFFGPAEEGLETAPVPAAAPVDAPVETEKPGEVKKNERNPYDKDPAGLAVDIYGYLDQSIPVVERMEIAVKLVEQAKEAFE